MAFARILHIDERLDAQQRVARILHTHLPSAAIFVTSHPAGIDIALAAGPIDLVLMDAQLSWADPLGILRILKARDRSMPVLLVAQPIAEELLIAALRAGLDEYVPKTALLEERLPLAIERAAAQVRQRRYAAALEMALQATAEPELAQTGALAFDTTADRTGPTTLFSTPRLPLSGTALAERVALTIENARLYREAQQQRDQLAVILEGVTDAVIARDRSGRAIYGNTAAARFCGYESVAALLAAGPDDLLQHFEVCDAAGAPLAPSRLPGPRALARGQPSEIVLRLRVRATGAERWVAASATPVLDEHGQTQLAISIFREITAQKRTQDSVQFLAQASTALAASLDYEATLAALVRLAVPFLATWCFVDVVQDDGTIQTVALEHRDPAIVPLARQALGRLLVLPLDQQAFPTAGQLVEPPAHIALEPNDQQLLRTVGCHSIICLPLLVGGRQFGRIGLVRDERQARYDASDLQLAEELARRVAMALEHAQLYQALQDAVTARDQFLSIAAHELRSPLTALMGHLSLLERRAVRANSLTPELAQSLAVLQRQSSRLKRLIEELLDISRLQLGRLQLALAPLDLCDVVRQVVDEMRLVLDQHPLTLQLPDTPVMLSGDSVRLHQVVQNLLENAVKYSPDKTPILVRVAVQGGQVTLAVIDQGIGIPATDLPQIFTRFYRASNVDGALSSGLGLGLSVIRELVTLHGGTITVQSVQGQGSTFTLSLPL
ncbi:MAG: hypothetical protein OHK0022_08440 [Roseiflexaceae bacterium]